MVNKQILDASLIANEIIEDWSAFERTRVVLKLDLEKTFDTVDCDVIGSILKARGFGCLWRSWIRGCVTSAN